MMCPHILPQSFTYETQEQLCNHSPKTWAEIEANKNAFTSDKLKSHCFDNYFCRPLPTL